MKTLGIALFTSLLGQISFAQDTNVNQDQKIGKLVEIYKSSLNNNQYYRIQVGFGDYNKAQEIKTKVQEDFPNLSSKIDFDSPTYRVRVGAFTSKMDAERKFNEVRIKYPNAMLLKPKKSTN